MTRLLLVAAVALVAALACVGAAVGATWVVDDSGGAGVDYTTIQAAVDAASDGDTIEVRSGIYNENVGVDKRITLIGDGADVVRVRAKSSYDNVFEVTADYVSISGFTVTWACYQYAGIYLNGADHCNISANTASGNNYYGIYLEDSSENTLTNNIANSNNFYGIRLDDSSENTLTGNTASSNNGYGIRLSGSNNLLVSNTMSGNACNFDVYGSHDIDASNTVNGKPIYYWVDQKDRRIPSDAGFVGVVNGTNITVRDLTLTLTNNSHGVLFAYTENSRIENVTASNNPYGIKLEHSSNNTLVSNTVSNNRYGIWLDSSSNNTLTNNIANSTSCYGIHLSSSRGNTLTGNTANSSNNNGIFLSSGSRGNTLTGNTANSNNHNGIFLSAGSDSNTLAGNTANLNDDDGIYLFVSWDNMLTCNTANSNNNGIYLHASSGNTLYHNNLADNADHNACDDGTSQWDSGSEGNYYSDYTGTDSNGDGIGDTSYPIPGDRSADRFPLMQPWTDTPQKGDLNSDGSLTSADAVIALEIAVGSRPCDAAMLTAADVSGDGRVTSLDALMLLQAAAGVIDSL